MASPERVYHRIESDTQTAHDAQAQERSGELWGYPPQGSDIPTVQAYDGPLPEGRRGVEFTTTVLPDRRSAPGEPRWSGRREGVVVENDVAKIAINVTRNTQLEAP